MLIATLRPGGNRMPPRPSADNTVCNGQELLLSPSLQPVRVRGLQALGVAAGQVAGVARVALNLRGVPPDVPARGIHPTASRRTTCQARSAQPTIRTLAAPSTPSERRRLVVCQRPPRSR